VVDKTNAPIKFVGNCKELYPKYIEMKRRLGCKYYSEERLLSGFDKFLLKEFPELSENEITREAIEYWESKRPHESPKTHSSRMLVVRKFCEYAVMQGHSVFVSAERTPYKSVSTFVPHIYSDDELQRFFAVVDNRKVKPVMLTNKLFYPTVFRLLYCCGLRLMEALNLLIRDVDFEKQTLLIRNTKFGKDRIIPFGDELTESLNKYFSISHFTKPDDYFFTSPKGGRYNGKTVEAMFHQIREKAGIVYCGRNKGPRIHDFRHTFAVTRLRKWFDTGVDIQIKLPVLSAYLGHADLRGTQRYLQLTSQMYPRIIHLFEDKYGDIFPKVGVAHE
jgi:integrase